MNPSKIYRDPTAYINTEKTVSIGELSERENIGDSRRGSFFRNNLIAKTENTGETNFALEEAEAGLKTPFDPNTYTLFDKKQQKLEEKKLHAQLARNKRAMKMEEKSARSKEKLETLKMFNEMLQARLQMLIQIMSSINQNIEACARMIGSSGGR